MRYSIYFLQPLPCFEGVVEVEVCPINFSWRRRGRGGVRGVVEVRYSIYFLEHVPRFSGVVEVEVYPISSSWRRRGRGGVEVW